MEEMQTKEDPVARGWTVSVAGSLAISTLLAGSGIAQDQPIKRTELLRSDMPGVPGKEVVVFVADFAPGAVSVRHHHPGEEIIYQLEGTLLLKPDNGNTITLHKGQIDRSPAGRVHEARNGSATEPDRQLIVLVGADKGQPLAIADK